MSEIREFVKAYRANEVKWRALRTPSLWGRNRGFSRAAQHRHEQAVIRLHDERAQLANSLRASGAGDLIALLEHESRMRKTVTDYRNLYEAEPMDLVRDMKDARKAVDAFVKAHQGGPLR